MTQAEQQTAAKRFSEYWHGKGDEKQETQRFWIGLLQTVLGVENPAQYIEFEKRVQLKHTSFIDGYIPATKVLIEQKGAKIDLHKAYEQSDGSVLTPYQQAKRYADEMPYSLRPAWIVVCNFREFLIYNMENPHAEPTQILLENLAKDYYLLDFISRHKTESLQRELELSIEAGKIVGELYDELLKQYKKKDDFELKSLNMLCVRLVFCLYAEDSGIFGKRLMFHDFLASFNAENVRTALIDLFRVLDTPSEEERDHLHLPSGTETRDPYLDEKFAQFPYVNGGLFRDEKILIPPFNDRIRDFLLNKASSFDWSEISPTIFGAVFESTLNPETRRSGGMHYTSIENIHRVIDPLFMDALWEEFAVILNPEGVKNPCRPVILNEREESIDVSAAPQHDTQRDSSAALRPQNDAVVRPVETTRTGKTSVVSRTSTTALTKKQKERLLAFQKKLGSLTFLDPACGSGNFLTETYLSLRRLENRVISLLNSGEKVLGFDEFICVKISQFYGIEINDFAVTVAKTALWIAESQMISETEQIVSQTIDFLPLTTNAFIVEGNALRMDWATLTSEESMGLSPLSAADTLFAAFTTQVDGTAHHYDYIMGNPPFVGASMMTAEQKNEAVEIFGKIKLSNSIDYVGAWYFKACELVKGTNTKCAFVSTNSITQGEQVAPLWKTLYERYNVNINFAYRTFRWDSESSEKAHVHCVIIGFSACNDELVLASPKIIFDEAGTAHEAKNINAYLIDAPMIFVESTAKPICDVQPMYLGNKPADGGNLILSSDEVVEILKTEPELKQYIKRYVGADDYINNKLRYCFWLKNVPPSALRKSKELKQRIEKVREMRLASTAKPTRQMADQPHLFFFISQPETNYLLIPSTSSFRRRYIPVGFMSPDVIASNAATIIPNATLYDFGIITSNVHMAWMRVVCGRLKSDYRYSNSIVYNTFPWPKSTDEQKAKIEQTGKMILDTRTKYPDESLADLYDETFMPLELRRAHQANDRAVMEAYGFGAKMTEAEIVGELFKMYEKLAK